MSPAQLPPTERTATCGGESTDFAPFPTFAPRPESWPAPLTEDAYHGLAGEIVRAIEPHSEADPAALLVQLLVAFGNAAGRGAGVRVEADYHAPNLFALIVGDTSKGRKGSSRRQATKPLELADSGWSGRITTGLVSGEGLIYEVRDPITARRKARNEGERARSDGEGYVIEETDSGVSDKRALIVESEFASTLRVMGRDGSSLSAVVRQAWDGGELRTMAKTSPARATGAHVSIIGHITRDELRRELTATDAGNGFANRFLLVCARRSKMLPHGGKAHTIDWGPHIQALRHGLAAASVAGDMHFDDDAAQEWAAAYAAMADGRPGLLGAVTARSEAQVLRLALLYALLDCAPVIRVEHLRAALAVWNYCEASAAHVFGDRVGDKLADQLLSELRERQMTRSDMRDMLGGRVPSDRIDAALELLASAGLARCNRENTGGRPAETWHALVEETYESRPETNGRIGGGNVANVENPATRSGNGGRA
jgi:hypothetical protein